MYGHSTPFPYPSAGKIKPVNRLKLVSTLTGTDTVVRSVSMYTDCRIDAQIDR